jgi:molybdate transport system regulatory protein
MGQGFMKEDCMTGTCGATHVELHKMDQLDPNTLLRLALSAQEEISRRGLVIPTSGKGKAPRAARMFQLPVTVKHLSSAQLDILTRSS